MGSAIDLHFSTKNLIGLFLLSLLSYSESAMAQGDRASDYDISAPLQNATAPSNPYYVFIEDGALWVKNWPGRVTWVHSSQSDVFEVEKFNTKGPKQYTFTVQDDYVDGMETRITDVPPEIIASVVSGKMKFKSAPLDVGAIDNIVGARKSFEFAGQGKDFALAQFFIGNFPPFVDNGTYTLPGLADAIPGSQIAALSLAVVKADGNRVDRSVMKITKEHIFADGRAWPDVDEDGVPDETVDGHSGIYKAAWTHLGMLYCDNDEDPKKNSDGSQRKNLGGTEFANKYANADDFGPSSRAHFDCGAWTNMCYGTSCTYDLPPENENVIIGLARSPITEEAESGMSVPREIARFVVPYAALKEPGRLTLVTLIGKPTVVMVFVSLR